MRKSKLKKYYEELWHEQRREPGAVLLVSDVLKRLKEIRADSKERGKKKEEVAP